MLGSESPADIEVEWDQPEPGPDWAPEVQAIFKHWRAIAPAGHLPGRQHLNPAAIAKLLPSIWMMDVQSAPFRLRYRLVGTRVVYGIGRDVTGRWLDEAHPDMASNPRYLERYRRVAETHIPNWRRGPPRLAIRLDFQIIENLVLPLATDGEQVDVLMALTVFHSSSSSSSGA